MTMNHGSTDATAAVTSDCANCHPNSKKSGFFPGVFHDSLSDMQMPQPTSCSSCHLDAMPIGFVGPTATNPARTPSTGEMRHDAVGWVGGAPTNAHIVSTNCGICHHVADSSRVTWATGKGRRDRPVSRLAQQRGAGATDVVHGLPRELAAGGRADQDQRVAAGGDVRSTTPRRSPPRPVIARPATPRTRGAVVHVVAAGSRSTSPARANPADLPALSRRRAADVDQRLEQRDLQEFAVRLRPATPLARPTATARIARSATPGRAPARGAAPRTGPSGHFDHGSDDARGADLPRLPLDAAARSAAGRDAGGRRGCLGFDHAAAGAGECLGCHAATTAAGRFVDYTNPATHTLPGGDWKGGVGYPGSSFARIERSVHQRHRDAVDPRRDDRQQRPAHDDDHRHHLQRDVAHVVDPAGAAVGGADQRARQHQVLALPHQQQRHGHQLQQRQVPRRADQLPRHTQRGGRAVRAADAPIASTATRS